MGKMWQWMLINADTPAPRLRFWLPINLITQILSRRGLNFNGIFLFKVLSWIRYLHISQPELISNESFFIFRIFLSFSVDANHKYYAWETKELSCSPMIKRVKSLVHNCNPFKLSKCFKNTSKQTEGRFKILVGLNGKFLYKRKFLNIS